LLSIAPHSDRISLALDLLAGRVISGKLAT
jgi:hypothetical protein